MNADSAGVLTQRERKRFVDALTIATIAAMFVSAAVPWFLHAVEIDLQTLAWAAFLLGLAYISIAVIIDRVGSKRVVVAALFAGPAVAVVIAAILWHFAGGIDQPALLIAFVIPIIAAAVVPYRLATFATAFLASIVVTITAAIESPAFTWYLTQLGFPAQAMLVLPTISRGALLRDVPPPSLFTWLLTFAVSMFTAAAFCAALSRFVRQEWAPSARATTAARETLAGAALHASPTPLVIVTAATAQVVDASTSFVQRMLRRREEMIGKELFDFANFEDRQGVSDLLTRGGRLEFTSIRVGSEERLIDLRIEPFRQNNFDYCTITMHEWDSSGYLVAAENANDRALLIAGSDGRLRYGNRAAAHAIGDVYVGRDIASIVQAASAGSVRVNEKEYDTAARTSAGLTIITLTPRQS